MDVGHLPTNTPPPQTSGSSSLKWGNRPCLQGGTRVQITCKQAKRHTRSVYFYPDGRSAPEMPCSPWRGEGVTRQPLPLVP